MRADLVLPRWDVIANERGSVSEEVYVAWLTEERRHLIESGELERLRLDPARRPVDVPFVWQTTRLAARQQREQKACSDPPLPDNG
jgi:hypothetical protein